MTESIFSQVKKAVRISDYVRSLPQTSGLHSVGGSRWRCNNIISGGTNPDAMMIDDEQGFFKVFSHDQQGGDVITLHALLSGVESSVEAARSLAQHMGVHVTEEVSLKPSLRPIMDSICKVAHDYLVNSREDDAVQIREYLASRGLEDELRDSWRLGALPSSPAVARKLLLQCADKNTLKTLGMLSGDRDFVAMAGRLLFPILSLSGQCQSFSSRVVPGVSTPLPDSKYINTSSTPIYDKSSVLYGQHLLAGNPKSRIIVCEGNFDVIALNAATDDDTIALATCGTALTEGHIKLLSTRSRDVTLMFDSDKAGQAAASSALWICNHIDDAFLAKTGNKDPWDDYVEGNLTKIIREPLIEGVCRGRAESLPRQEFLSWIRKTINTLNFSEDRDRLLEIGADLVGASPSTLASATTSPRERNRVKPQESMDGEPGPEASRLVSALLCLEIDHRKDVAFPLISRKYKEGALEICGVTDDEDIELLCSVADGQVHPWMYKLVTDPEISPAVSDACKYLALRLMRNWRTERPRDAGRYISTLSRISSSGGDERHLAFLFDLVALSA